MKKYTWDDLYRLAEDTGCGDPRLKAKDEAREQVREFAIDFCGERDLEEDEIPEDTVDYFCEKYDIRFDEDGNIIDTKFDHIV